METIGIPTVSEAKKKVKYFLDYVPEEEFALCPVKDVLHSLSDKWSMLIMMVLGTHETLRFSELKSAVKEISQKVLTCTLRDLESYGLVSRKVYAEVPPKVEYTITPQGVKYLQHLVVMLDWACESLPEIKENKMKKVG